MVDEEWNEFLSRCDKVTSFQHRQTSSLALDGLSNPNDINTTRGEATRKTGPRTEKTRLF